MNFKFIKLIFVLSILSLNSSLYAGESIPAAGKPSSGDLTTKSWIAHGKKDIEATSKYTQECIDLYKEQAQKEQASLSALPKNKKEIEAVQTLNDVATCYFIQAESLMRQQKTEEAKKIFKLIMDKYSYGQAWDPRGWFWSLRLAAEQSIKKIETGSIEVETKKKVSQLPTKLVLLDPGKEEFVDYEKYGQFKNVGTKDYQYVITDQEGLMAAVGEGVYPNNGAIRKNPIFKQVIKDKRLEGDAWDFLYSPDQEAAFIKWATSSEPQGVKLFCTAQVLERAGLITQAIKCYYSILVHFPGSYGWTYWHTPWYVGQAAIAKINYLLKCNPQLGYKLQGAQIDIINGFDNEIINDTAIVNPGKFVKVDLAQEAAKVKPTADALGIKKEVGSGKVRLVQYKNDDWQLLVDGQPYIIKGITYTPTKVGQSPDEGTLGNWMEEDFNKNGKIDGPFDAFVDENRNNLQDADELAVGDFKLLQDMGANTIRLYHHPAKVNKELMRQMYNDYGIRVILGDFLGKYAIGSGASWNPGTDYNNEEHKKKMIASVTAMVNEFKDEPYILFWLLGNENVYGYACNANEQPEAYFKFANEVAKIIKSIDPQHPVAICSGDILFLDKFGKNAPDIDIFGTNAYRGDYGFGAFWRQVKEQSGKPAFITEFGCPSYAEGKSIDEAEQLQAQYHSGSWEDMENNMAFNGAAGNCIGGVVFEWLDEWWKAYEPAIHDTKGLWSGPFPDGFMHEEWLGIAGQGDGKESPFLRQLRKAYYMYQKKWK
ncbi:MAG TPA: glycoside hydrolase family 2 TIM barrel-domain containing protein [Candidatus Omnitrophota bacterium]|nr:glycoside hydrolase family 2 TIM barrel-domain containing protein [Candidatus Omnitrophota bacterium]HPT38956.1 glycoside hydrolase family 2 TIM barrel-domain containing protein [Candidatus Omnitrophota bacterium]